MKSTKVYFTSLTLILLTVAPTFAITHHVPADFTTIQAGLDASANGDTVLVQPGTYYENIVWPQVNGIKLIAAGDSSNTIIDGNDVWRVVDISSEGLIDTTTLFHGFTVRDGSFGYEYQHGAGIRCDESSPTISNCRITSNQIGEYCKGAGIFIGFASPTIINCRIDENTTDYEGDGGGIYCGYSSSPIIDQCTISDNHASDEGGGICCGGESLPRIRNCEISGNQAQFGGGLFGQNQMNVEIVACIFSDNSADDGGAICIAGFGPIIYKCTITGNEAYGWGGGVFCGSSTEIVECEIFDNSSLLGGGIFFTGGSPVVSNSLIHGNSASHQGAGVFMLGSSATVNYCTIVNNYLSEDYASGAGIVITDSFWHDIYPTVQNSIISDNTGEGVYIDSVGVQCHPTVAYCDVTNNSLGNFSGPGVDPDWGAIVTINAKGDSCDVYNNIFLDPMYVDPENGDFHLQAGSPCIDAGDPSNPFDPDSTVADIGAFYFDQNVGVNEDRFVSADDLPATWTLLPAYPNPFNASTTLTVSLPQPATLNVSVFNIAGQQVTTLASGRHNAGLHRFTFDASHLASGVYFIHATMKPGSEDPGHPAIEQTQKIVLLR